MTVLFILIGVLMLATLVVMAAGVFLMGTGGKANAKYGNRLMIARVVLQASVLVLVLLTMVLGAAG